MIFLSLLDTPLALAGTISLVIEIVVLALVLYGYFLKRKLKFRPHGKTMLTAVILHGITIFAVMIPSFVLGFSSPASINYLDPLVILSLVHVAAGTIAFVFGVWFVASWHLKADFSTCVRKKIFMRYTIITWIAAVFLGIVIYYFFWVSYLVGA